MVLGHRYEIESGSVHVRSSGRSDGSFALGEAPSVLSRRRRELLGAANDRSWVALRQVHGATVFTPGAAGLEPQALAALPRADAALPQADAALPQADAALPQADAALPQADAALCTDEHHAVSVLTADCAPVVLVGSTGVAVAHAGWRGAAAGVIDAAAEALRRSGAEPVATVLGPCIQPAAYEFQPADLEPVVALFGSAVIGTTSSGATALDLTRVVQLSCERAGWPVPDRPACTSDPGFYSHRTRADLGRQATVAWIEH